MNRLLRPALLAAATALALPALAQQAITVVNFGGASGVAQKKAYFDAYEKATGGQVTQVEYNGEQSRIKAMVETKKVTWDVVEAEGAHSCGAVGCLSRGSPPFRPPVSAKMGECL